MKRFKDTAEYITSFPKEQQKLLINLRKAIKKQANDAEEIISYNMPAYKYQGKILVYFAGYARHIGFYAMPGPIANYKKELKGYKTSKGTVQFPIGEPIPAGLVGKLIKYRMKEIKEKNKSK
jgi:uncharacterized protein YdhG (YjbR/CyaY superfamily)